MAKDEKKETELSNGTIVDPPRSFLGRSIDRAWAWGGRKVKCVKEHPVQALLAGAGLVFGGMFIKNAYEERKAASNVPDYTVEDVALNHEEGMLDVPFDGGTIVDQENVSE